MVVKAIINALGKGAPKPKNFLQAANLKKEGKYFITRCSKEG